MWFGPFSLLVWWTALVVVVVVEGRNIFVAADTEAASHQQCMDKPRRRRLRQSQDRLWGPPYHATKALLTTPLGNQTAAILLKFPQIVLPRKSIFLNATLQLFFRSSGGGNSGGGGGGLTALRMTSLWSEDRTGGINNSQQGPLRIGVDTVSKVSFGILNSNSPPQEQKQGVVQRNVTADVAYWLQHEAVENQGWALLPFGSGNTFDQDKSWTLYSSDSPQGKNKSPTLLVWFCRGVPPKTEKEDNTAPAPEEEEEEEDGTATPNGPTYVPGELTVVVRDKWGRSVLLSTGMTGRPLAYSRDLVEFDDGTKSSRPFHSAPDAAAVFTENDGTYVYTSNSEIRKAKGGVFSLKFNATTHNVVDYFAVLTGTSFNCGGGKTPWNTWISCEEAETWGRVWQVDPFGRIPQGNLTGLVARGGSYESVAHQMVLDEGEEYPIFYITEDDEYGDLVRFIPNEDGRACYRRNQQWCTVEHGTHSYLRLNFLTRIPGIKAGAGNFTFGRRQDANGNDYLMAEGIDVKDDMLYFTSKFQKRLYILNLLEGTFTYSSTKSGAFEHEPDQVSRILGGSGASDENILYFCEDGDYDCGVHARSANGRFYSILDGGKDYQTETTGLAFSPDGTRMYVSFQFPGTLWQFWRTDGLPFGGQFLDIKYHST